MTDSVGNKNDNPLNYAFDGGLLYGCSPLDDTPESIEFEAGDGQESDQSSESDSETESLADLASCFRVFSESMLKLELAELKMIQERERLRFEAEKRRMELETQLTQMMMQTQLQIASVFCHKSSNRKRKRSEDPKIGFPERYFEILLLFFSFFFKLLLL